MHKHDLAPIVLFVYNRPWHTEQTLNSLRKNPLAKESVLYVFADGPKENATPEDRLKIIETRAVLRKKDWCKEIIIIEGDINKGLATSVIKGVTEIVNKHGKIVVLEDDLVLAPTFLEFMNDGLNLYQDKQNIYSINGYMFPFYYKEEKTVLLPYTSTWGWATWSSKWKAFRNDMQDKNMLETNPFLASKFNLANYRYTDMLNYGNNSWGIKWYFAIFIRNGLNVFPSKSLVSNIGFDGSGENCVVEEIEGKLQIASGVRVSDESEIDLKFYNAFINFFSKKRNSKSKLAHFFNYFK